MVSTLTPGPSPAAHLIPARVKETAQPGDIAEVCPVGQAILRDIADHLKEYGGAALLIDYGHEHSSVGETFQAVRHHEYTDPFAEPGDADLTTHVDFDVLQQLARMAGAHAHPLLTQADFLIRMGILDRTAQLKAHCKTPAQANDVETAAQRLIGTDQMGQLFKVLALSGPTLPYLPGFE